MEKSKNFLNTKIKYESSKNISENKEKLDYSVKNSSSEKEDLKIKASFSNNYIMKEMGKGVEFDPNQSLKDMENIDDFAGIESEKKNPVLDVAPFLKNEVKGKNGSEDEKTKREVFKTTNLEYVKAVKEYQEAFEKSQKEDGIFSKVSRSLTSKTGALFGNKQLGEKKELVALKEKSERLKKERMEKFFDGLEKDGVSEEVIKRRKLAYLRRSKKSVDTEGVEKTKELSQKAAKEKFEEAEGMEKTLLKAGDWYANEAEWYEKVAIMTGVSVAFGASLGSFAALGVTGTTGAVGIKGGRVAFSVLVGKKVSDWASAGIDTRKITRQERKYNKKTKQGKDDIDFNSVYKKLDEIEKKEGTVAAWKKFMVFATMGTATYSATGIAQEHLAENIANTSPKSSAYQTNVLDKITEKGDVAEAREDIYGNSNDGFINESKKIPTGRDIEMEDLHNYPEKALKTKELNLTKESLSTRADMGKIGSAAVEKNEGVGDVLARNLDFYEKGFLWGDKGAVNILKEAIKNPELAERFNLEIDDFTNTGLEDNKKINIFEVKKYLEEKGFKVAWDKNITENVVPETGTIRTIGVNEIKGGSDMWATLKGPLLDEATKKLGLGTSNLSATERNNIVGNILNDLKNNPALLDTISNGSIQEINHVVAGDKINVSELAKYLENKQVNGVNILERADLLDTKTSLDKISISEQPTYAGKSIYRFVSEDGMLEQNGMIKNTELGPLNISQIIEKQTNMGPWAEAKGVSTDQLQMVVAFEMEKLGAGEALEPGEKKNFTQFLRKIDLLDTKEIIAEAKEYTETLKKYGVSLRFNEVMVDEVVKKKSMEYGFRNIKGEMDSSPNLQDALKNMGKMKEYKAIQAELQPKAVKVPEPAKPAPTQPKPDKPAPVETQSKPKPIAEAKKVIKPVVEKEPVVKAQKPRFEKMGNGMIRDNQTGAISDDEKKLRAIANQQNNPKPVRAEQPAQPEKWDKVATAKDGKKMYGRTQAEAMEKAQKWNESHRQQPSREQTPANVRAPQQPTQPEQVAKPVQQPQRAPVEARPQTSPQPEQATGQEKFLIKGKEYTAGSQAEAFEMYKNQQAPQKYTMDGVQQQEKLKDYNPKYFETISNIGTKNIDFDTQDKTFKETRDYGNASEAFRKSEGNLKDLNIRKLSAEHYGVIINDMEQGRGMKITTKRGDYLVMQLSEGYGIRKPDNSTYTVKGINSRNLEKVIDSIVN